MPHTRRNRTVTVIDDHGKFVSRITVSAAERKFREQGGKWIRPGKILWLPVGFSTDPKSAKFTPEEVEARGLWRNWLKLGKDPTKGNDETLTWPEFIRWVESMNVRYGLAKR